jgi:hypothetical protein
MLVTELCRRGGELGAHLQQRAVHGFPFEDDHDDGVTAVIEDDGCFIKCPVIDHGGEFRRKSGLAIDGLFQVVHQHRITRSGFHLLSTFTRFNDDKEAVFIGS